MTHFYRYFNPLTYTKFNQTPTLLCDTLYKVVLVRDLGGGKGYFRSQLPGWKTGRTTISGLCRPGCVTSSGKYAFCNPDIGIQMNCQCHCQLKYFLPVEVTPHRRRRQKRRQRSSLLVGGAELIQFHAALQIQHQDDMKKIKLFFKSSLLLMGWCGIQQFQVSQRQCNCANPPCADNFSAEFQVKRFAPTIE